MVDKPALHIVKAGPTAPYVFRFCKTVSHALTERESQSKRSPAVPKRLDSNRKEICISVPLVNNVPTRSKPRPTRVSFIVLSKALGGFKIVFGCF